MSKIATDLEQSKQLAEILPIESADMYWWYSGKRYYIISMDDNNYNEGSDIPAWSLSALLKVLPAHITKGNKVYNLSTEKYESIVCDKNNDELYKIAWSYDVRYVNKQYRLSLYATKSHDDPIDSCVEMIKLLKNKKLLKTC